MQLVPIRVPIPYSIVSWKRDPRGRDFAPIPGFGEIVRLSEEETATARETVEQSARAAIPLVFEIEFQDGTKALFMSRNDIPSVEEGKNGHTGESAPSL